MERLDEKTRSGQSVFPNTKEFVRTNSRIYVTVRYGELTGRRYVTDTDTQPVINSNLSK